MWMLLTHAYSKMARSAHDGIKVLIKHLQQIFATHGISHQVVSDNGPQFVPDTTVNLVEFNT